MPDSVADFLQAPAPVTRRVRAYFAPIDRTTVPVAQFDPAGMQGFDVDQPPAPWVDLGNCTAFVRTSGTKVEAVRTGSPAVVTAQARTEVEATVAVQFDRWGALQQALTSGGQTLHVLASPVGAALNGSGGVAVPATGLQAGCTATVLMVDGVAAAGFAVGDVVVVDDDFSGAAGFVGAGGSGGYVKASVAATVDVDFVRRVSRNVGRVANLAGGALTLGAALPAGVPTPAMKVSQVVGSCDREGGSYFHEWAALFVMEGEQGDRVFFHYPRLQTMGGTTEVATGFGAGTLQTLRLAGRFRALPVKDRHDGEGIVCFRSYLAAGGRVV